MSIRYQKVIKYRVRQRGCSLTNSARTPPARNRNNFLGRGFFWELSFFGGAGFYFIFLGSVVFLGRGFFLGRRIFLGAGDFFWVGGFLWGGVYFFLGGGDFLDFF